MNCISAGGGIGADCNGYPENGVRFDSPTFGGFSVSGGVYEDDVKDIAVKYAADWNGIKVAFPAAPSSAGSLAMLLAMRRASSSVSTPAMRASAGVLTRIDIGE